MTIKYAVLEHLYLPDRGLRFWTTLTEFIKEVNKLYHPIITCRLKTL